MVKAKAIYFNVQALCGSRRTSRSGWYQHDRHWM